ncbi:hypothetical protein ACV0BM_013825 [Elizabethkingia meningoseptica]|uniref:hypothetical protein n=1 Tax=Elizabethkingia meningoseptica TaxID=238 RepID=UPI000841CDA8|nr:hypothetical protein [Elizabethkingia meningoseptica]ODM52225.1 hypothetical protein BES09_15730 [Elizabethkingia meningoseptica]OHT26973.1 hypothetical protein BFF93_15645 [Elizabethkingia meningoseptica]OPC10837.1 hypothetical protein BAX93_10420 [Elizabethkingia meningoseptica]
MKKSFIIFFILISTFSFSQKYIDASITKTDNTVINSKVKVYTNIFYTNLINEASFYRALILVDDNGRKIEKIKAENVKELKFTDFEGKSKTYLNNGKALKELVYDGTKVKWYRAISQNLYDASIQYFDYLVDDKGQIYKMGLFNNIKKKLIEVTKSKPELATEIENTRMTNESMLRILQKYDQE